MERLGVPFLVFANKIDRSGASADATMDALREALAGDAVALYRPTDLGSRSAAVRPRHGAELVDELVDRLSACDDAVLRTVVEGPDPLTEGELRSALARSTPLATPIRCCSVPRCTGGRP